MGLFAGLFRKKSAASNAAETTSGSALSRDKKLEDACAILWDFMKFFVEKTTSTNLDPRSQDFGRLSQPQKDASALVSLGVLFGAATAIIYFSDEPRKRVKEFAYYLTSRMKMPPQEAEIVAELVEERRKLPTMKDVIQQGHDAFLDWVGVNDRY